MKTIDEFLLDEFKKVGLPDIRICFILVNEEDDNIVVAYNKNNPEQIYTILDYSEASYMSKEKDWKFVIDHYLFKNILDFEITYMPLEEHIRVWKTISKNTNKFDYTNGLQFYLAYCVTTHIGQELVTAIYGRNKEMEK